MHKKLYPYAVLATVLNVQPALAHIGYGDLGTLSAIGDASPILTKTSFSRYGWLAGADNDLGDSHKVGGSTGFYKFSLAQALTVNITVTAASNKMNPAFSVYAGLLPDYGHDYSGGDPIMSYDNTGVLYAASPRDMRPDDPQISHYIPVGYDETGSPLLNEFYNPILIENPIWNTPNPNGIDLGGLTPAQWYQQNYQPHDGYRDTLNFTTLGGLKYDAEFGGWVPGNYDALNGPYQGFSGQFDPFGDWSMTNDGGEWSEIAYISSVSDTACAGPNCVSTTAGGFTNPGHFAGNNGLTESMILKLAAGIYTIAVDGEFCNEDSSACMGPQMTANIGITAVPLPGAVWLMASGLMFGAFNGGRGKARVAQKQGC